MKKVEIWIPGRLPGENEIIKAAKKSGPKTSNVYTKMKKDWGRYISNIFLECGLDQAEAIFVEIEWNEPDRRRDPDNVASGKKFIFDGMVESGFLPNDGWKQILGWRETFVENKSSPGVKLIISILNEKGVDEGFSFMAELADLFIRYNANLFYSKNDDGIHFEVDGVEVFNGWLDNYNGSELDNLIEASRKGRL